MNIMDKIEICVIGGPNPEKVKKDIKQAILGHILDTKPPTREEEKAEVEAMVWHNEISEYNRAKYGE